MALRDGDVEEEDVSVFVTGVALVVEDRRALLRIPPGDGDADAEPLLPSNLKSSSLRRPAKVGGGGVRWSSGTGASGDVMIALLF